MKRSLLVFVSLFAITLLPSGPLLAHSMGQVSDDEKCDFPVYGGKALDRKTKILDKPEPDFSSNERQDNRGQAIVLTALFCGSGKAVKIKVTKSVSYSIDAKAIEAAKRIRFVPAEKDGNKVSQWLILQYRVQ